MHSFNCFIVFACCLGGSALGAKQMLRGLASHVATAQDHLGFRLDRCAAGLYAEPRPATDLQDLWKPFNDSEAHTGVAVYVQFSKVGSESMRSTMSDGVENMRDTCFAHSGRRYRSGKPLPSLKHRHVVQGKYGLCDSPKAKSMACSYFTLLRDPVATAISMYTYFCQHCAEGRRFCSNPNVVAPSGDRCPNMSFVDFTRLNGNVYVKEFSGAYACADCDADGEGEPVLDETGAVICRPFEEACGALHSTASGLTEGSPALLERAKTNMAREVIPITLGELFDANGTYPAGTEVLSMAYGWTHLVPHFETHTFSSAGHYTPSGDEIDEVRRMLAPDLALYEFAKTVQHKAGEWLRAQGLAADELTGASVQTRAA